MDNSLVSPLDQWAGNKEALLSAIVDSSDDAILSKTLDGIITSWNKGAERIYGYKPADVIGKPVSILVPESMPDEIPEIMNRLREGKRIEHYETTRKRKDGRIFHVSLTVSPIRDESGKIIGASAIARDITEQQQLRQNRDYLASIVDSSQDAILSKTIDGIILTWNGGAEELYGYTAAEAIGSNVTLLIPPELAYEMTRFANELGRGAAIESYETVRIRKDGTRVEVSLTISPIRDASGKVIAASVFARDITSRKELEKERERLVEQLQDSLKEKEVLLQEVYHRVKNNLQLISSLLELRSRFISNEEQANAFRDSISRVRAMALIHEKLYQTEGLDRVDFNAYVKSLVDQLLRSYTVDKNIDFMISGRECHLSLNTALSLGLIFNELVTNSIKYAFHSDHKGQIKIEIQNDDQSLIVQLSDNGSGLPQQVDFSQANSFGFRIVKLLVAQMKGTIRAISDRGTHFEISVPLQGRNQ